MELLSSKHPKAFFLKSYRLTFENKNGSIEMMFVVARISLKVSVVSHTKMPFHP